MKGLLIATLGFANELVRRVLQPGDPALDGTAGNGHDTLFLARLVGPQGVVHAWDVQPLALANTRALLERYGQSAQVRLHLAGHERLAELLPPELQGRVRAAMFNLGFLPGADGAVITRPATTLAALDATLAVLAPGGLVTVVCYAGHPGGGEEAQAVADWCAGLDFGQARALHYEIINKRQSSIRLFCIEKRM